MRSMIASLDEKKSLEYQRPHSLEEAPPKEPGPFLRENNRDGYNSPHKQRESESMFGEQDAFENEEMN